VKARLKICVLVMCAEGEWYLVRFLPGQEEAAAEALASYAEDSEYPLSWENIEAALPEVRECAG